MFYFLFIYVNYLRDICTPQSTAAAVCITNPTTLEASYKAKVYSTCNSDIAALRKWLLAHNCHNVCMESTGKYWIPISNILESHMHIILTHLKYVRAIKGKKADKRSAKWITNLFRFDVVKASFIPPTDIRSLRELSRCRLKLAYILTAKKNRYQNSMTIYRIRINCVLTDPFEKTATNIMEYLLSGKPPDETECTKLIDGRVKSSAGTVLNSILRFEILSKQKFKMAHAKEHIDFINSTINELETELFHLSRPYDELVKRISKIVGYTELSALFFIS